MVGVGSVQFQMVPSSSLYLFSRSVGLFQSSVSVKYRILICCTCHFQSSSLFVYFGLLCLQVSSLSNFRHKGAKVVTYLGSLVQLCCGEGGTLQTNITGMCGECSPCLATLDLPQLMVACAFPVYTAQAPGCAAGVLSKVGPVFRALPRSKLLRLRFSGTLQGHRVSWVCVLYPSQVGAAQVTRCLASALSQVGHMS